MSWVITKNGQPFKEESTDNTEINVAIDRNIGNQEDVYLITYTDANGCKSDEKRLTVPPGNCGQYYVCSVPCYENIDASNYKNINIRYTVDESTYAVKKPLNALGKTIEGVTIREEDIYFYSTAPACTATILYPSSIKNKERDTSPTGDGVNLTTSNNTHDFQLYERVKISVPPCGEHDCYEGALLIHLKSTQGMVNACSNEFVKVGIKATDTNRNTGESEVSFSLVNFTTGNGQEVNLMHDNDFVSDLGPNFGIPSTYEVKYVLFEEGDALGYYCDGGCKYIYSEQGRQTENGSGNGGNGDGNGDGNGTAGELPDPGNENQGNENNNDEPGGHHGSGTDEPQVQP